MQVTQIARRIPGVPVNMGASFSRSLEVSGFLLTHARFAPGIRIPPHHHDRACVALMLGGGFDVQFPRVTHPCPPRVVVIEPAGETHGNRVGGTGAEVRFKARTHYEHDADLAALRGDPRFERLIAALQ